MVFMLKKFKHRSREAHLKEKLKTEKNKKESLVKRLAMEGLTRFFEKILPDEGRWRFFEKPVGLDLDRPCAMACVRQPNFADFFCW
jgi:hypothetical protein